MMRVSLPTASLKTTGRWLQDYSDRSVLLPGGITLDPVQFPVAVAGHQYVHGGTLVSKKVAEELFGPYDPTDDEVYFLWKTVDLIVEGPLAEAVRRGLIFERFLPDNGVSLTAIVKTRLRGLNFQFGNYDGAGADE